MMCTVGGLVLVGVLMVSYFFAVEKRKADGTHPEK